MLSKIKSDFNELPGWARILLIFGTVCSIVKWFPIVELLQLFLFIVVIPLGFLTMVGLIAEETSNGVITAWQSVINTLKAKGKETVTEIIEPNPETPRNEGE